MSISNMEWRRRVIGERHEIQSGRQARAASGTIARDVIRGLVGRARAAIAAAGRPQTGSDGATPIADKAALSARLRAYAQAKVRPAASGRMAFVDAGKGLAALLAIFLAIVSYPGDRATPITWIDGLTRFLHPFAIPAFLAFCGMVLKNSREDSWTGFAGRKLAPFAGALLLWALAVSTLAQAGVLPRTSQSSPAPIALAPIAVLLLTTPLFLALWRALRRLRTGTVFVIAAVVEILHTENGGALWIEAMRGMVYLAAGYCFAQTLRAMARFARHQPIAAAAMLVVWAAFNAFAVFADVPMAYGAKISALPFASLALGLSGAAAMAMLGEMLAASRFGAFFGLIGRRWIAIYAAAPIAVVACAESMAHAGLFQSAQDALAALLFAVLAAAAALIALEWRTPSGQAATSEAQRL